jgi:predicted DNA-binding transcriptional regulator AlpA
MDIQNRDDLVGIDMLRAVLGTSRGRAFVISRDRSFPEPVGSPSRSRLWWRRDVEAWLDRYRPDWRE